MRFLSSLMIGRVSERTQQIFNALSSFNSDIHPEGKQWSGFSGLCIKDKYLVG
jgi:hypothetical protein